MEPLKLDLQWRGFTLRLEIGAGGNLRAEITATPSQPRNTTLR